MPINKVLKDNKKKKAKENNTAFNSTLGPESNKK